MGKIYHKKNADFDQTKGFLMTKNDRISPYFTKEGRVSFENGFLGGGGGGVSKLNIYEVPIRSTYPFSVCVRIACHHHQANSNLVCCSWKYCLCALIKQTPFFGVLLVLLFVCALIKQTPLFWCVVGVTVCVRIDQANSDLVCVVGVIVCVCIDQANSNLVCVVGVNCLCALITADSNLVSCCLCASSSGCVPIQCLCKDCLCASSGKQTANFVCCLCA